MSDYRPRNARPLYTAEERRRRDGSVWTLVQGVLAPTQFVIFLVSLILVMRYLATGEGESAAAISVVVKTLALYAIMVTGSIWEKVVFGRYLFAPAFFWEDVFSMLVLALHTLYLLALAFDWLDARGLMFLALAAYATYVVNATQFLLKLRAARLESTGLGPKAECAQ
jgi:3-vinyl bacteriochlorophyllide hydratase